MKQKTYKISCTFCGKEIECPENMKDSEKHACHECFLKLIENPEDEDLSKIHADIPMEKMDEIIPKMLISSLMKEAFPEVWNDIEKELKGKSQREIAERMFAEGIMVTFDAIITMGHESKKFRKEMNRKTAK